jgi:hypothetical protein
VKTRIWTKAKMAKAILPEPVEEGSERYGVEWR